MSMTVYVARSTDREYEDWTAGPFLTPKDVNRWAEEIGMEADFYEVAEMEVPAPCQHLVAVPA